MKAAFTILLLSLSSMAWAKDIPPLPTDKNSQMDKGAARCLESCQSPVVKCMGHCKGDPTCTQECHPEKMQQCAEKCGMVKPKKKK